MNEAARAHLNALFTNSGYWPRGLYFSFGTAKQFVADLENYVRPGDKCLDLGCSASKPYKPFVTALGLEWHGADLDEQTVPPDDRYKPVRDNTVPYPDQSFDAICTYHVVEHFTHPEAMFAEIRRCIKPGGIFCGACAFWEFEHYSFFHFTYRAVREILERHGFEVLSVRHSPYSGLVMAGQRFFGGDGRLHAEPGGRPTLRNIVRCSLNWPPFLAMNVMEWVRRTVFRRWHDPLRDASTLYFYARAR